MINSNNYLIKKIQKIKTLLAVLIPDKILIKVEFPWLFLIKYSEVPNVICFCKQRINTGDSVGIEGAKRIFLRLKLLDNKNIQIYH